MKENITCIVYKGIYKYLHGISTIYHVCIMNNDNLSERAIYYLNRNGFFYYYDGNSILIKSDVTGVNSEFCNMVKRYCLNIIRNKNLEELLNEHL